MEPDLHEVIKTEIFNFWVFQNVDPPYQDKTDKLTFIFKTEAQKLLDLVPNRDTNVFIYHW